MIDGSRVRGLLEPVSWTCVGAQVKYGSISWFGRHVKEHTYSMKLLVDFSPIYRNAYTLAAALSALVLVPFTNTNIKYSKKNNISTTQWAQSLLKIVDYYNYNKSDVFDIMLIVT